MNKSISRKNLTAVKHKSLIWANKNFNTIFCLDSNEYQSDEYSKYEFLLAAGIKHEVVCDENSAFDKLQAFFLKHSEEWKFGYFSYDLKNDIECLTSENHDYIEFPPFCFFVPQLVLGITKDLEAFIESEHAEEIWKDVNAQKNISYPFESNLTLLSRVDKEHYISNVNRIKEHILDGDVYEMNYCIELFQENVQFDPFSLFTEYNDKSRSPFASFIKLNDKYLMCGSPERFLQKTGSQLISQPIKGTIKRGRTNVEDDALKNQLKNDEKERAENVMIVDLVRNDLSRSCKPGTVRVSEIFGIYPFTFVHQMISTVSGEICDEVSSVEAIKNAFPMGSMTGAPKVMALKLIEELEDTKRGIYSGALGYISPNGDFDFNVVIRSFTYNSTRQYLSYMIGSAVTIDSDPEREYEECLLKAKGVW